MGGAVRWFKGLFGTKKRLVSSDGYDKEKEQNKNAIVVATAAATAAEAAVSVDKAAAEMARLTGEGRAGDIITWEERWAAVKIQKVFRGSLESITSFERYSEAATLVRGYLVRKRAAAMLHSIQALIRVQTAVRSKRNSCHKKEYSNMFQPRHSFDKFDEVAREERHQKIVEVHDMFKRRRKPRQTHNLVPMSEYEDGFVYRGSDLELNLPKEKWKFGTAQSTPRLSSSSKFATTPRLTSSSHHHAANNNRYYVMQCPSKRVCGNAQSGYGMNTPGPGYMENTQSFKAKQRSHSAPHRLSERNRI
ncbi:hypothetical protein Bca4012_098771 [Brassica carinata]